MKTQQVLSENLKNLNERLSDMTIRPSERNTILADSREGCQNVKSSTNTFSKKHKPIDE